MNKSEKPCPEHRKLMAMRRWFDMLQWLQSLTPAVRMEVYAVVSLICTMGRLRTRDDEDYPE